MGRNCRRETHCPGSGGPCLEKEYYKKIVVIFLVLNGFRRLKLQLEVPGLRFGFGFLVKIQVRLEKDAQGQCAFDYTVYSVFISRIQRTIWQLRGNLGPSFDNYLYLFL